jgi:hypothetical protein
MEPSDLAEVFAAGIAGADAARPIALNARSGTPYQAGIGPHTEGQTIRLALGAVADTHGLQYALEVPYPSAPRTKCDVQLFEPDTWVVEVKMLRMMGDNGKPNDNMLMHILSPYPVHRSALTDCRKLAESGFPDRLAIMIFGYDYPSLPMDPAIDSFEVLAAPEVALGERATANFEGLVHPVHIQGRVFVWELQHDR